MKKIHTKFFQIIADYLFEVGIHILLREKVVCQKQVKQYDPKPLVIGYTPQYIPNGVITYSGRVVKVFTTQARWDYHPLYCDKSVS